ncbi:MAG: carboxypeptidase regulatory-like domain-containing protein [Pedosphaera sp.]|nr:carboxypeptidase regulatory-like domain-containing protein [Pedosphaera sp.]
MFKTLQGNEPGLVGHWNFNDNTANDASPGRHHGALKENAKIVTARRPSALGFSFPVVVTGRVLDAEGQPLRNADIVTLQDGMEVGKARSNIAGEYRMQWSKLAGQSYDIRVTKENLAYETNGLNLSGGGSRTLDFTLYEMPSVFGSVLSADYKPRAGVKVQLERLPQTNVVATTLSNARGEYRFKNVAPGQYRVRAAGPGGPVYFGAGRTITLAERTPPNRADIALPEPTSASTQASVNQALQLDGGESYVELPGNLFNDLEEATIEGWARCDRIGSWMRFF